jgi:hypothetical protein
VRAAAILTLLVLLASASQSGAAPGTVSPSFTVAPASPLSLQPVTFRSTSSATKVKIASQAWDLDGDGAFEVPNAASVTKSFPRPGAHTVRLRVTDSKGSHYDAAAQVNVGNRPPAASIAQIPQSALVGDQVSFFSTSTDPDGAIVKHGWDLDGDGSYDDGASGFASRTYATPGAHPVALQVTDDQGAFGVASTAVSVAPRPGDATRLIVLGSPSLMSPFPIVHISGILRRNGIKLRLLTIEAPKGVRVQVDCRGRGCPFKRRRATVSASSQATGTVRFRQFRKRVLRTRAQLEIRVSHRAAVGKYTRFRVRRGSPPLRVDRCLPPGKRRPVACPTG